MQQMFDTRTQPFKHFTIVADLLNNSGDDFQKKIEDFWDGVSSWIWLSKFMRENIYESE